MVQRAFQTHLGGLIHGILGAIVSAGAASPGLLLRLPVCLLLEGAEAVPSGPFPTACADNVLPALLTHVASPEVTVAAVYVCCLGPI